MQNTSATQIQAMSSDPLSGGIRWTEPEDAWRDAVQAARWSAYGSWACIIGIPALFLWAAHHWLAPLYPGLPWGGIVLALFAIGVLVLITFLFDARLRTPRSYVFIAEGVLGLGTEKQRPFCPWRRIAGFAVAPHPRLTNRRVLFIHLVDGFRRGITLPGGDIEASLLAVLSSRLPEGPPPLKFAPLSHRDWLLGFVVTAMAAAGAMVSLRLYAHCYAPLSRDAIVWIGESAVYAGPGTWTAIRLWGRRAKPQVAVLAFVLNICGMIFCIFGAFAFLPHSFK